MPEIKEKIKIGGIKLSGERVQLNLLNQGKTPFPASHFFQVLTQNKINMSYVSASLSGGRLRSFCLIAPEDLDRVTYPHAL